MINGKGKSLETKKYSNVDTLSEDELYMLYFKLKLQKSQDDIKNGRVITLEELREHIDELEKKYENNNIQ